MAIPSFLISAITVMKTFEKVLGAEASTKTHGRELKMAIPEAEEPLVTPEYRDLKIGVL